MSYLVDNAVGLLCVLVASGDVGESRIFCLTERETENELTQLCNNRLTIVSLSVQKQSRQYHRKTENDEWCLITDCSCCFQFWRFSSRGQAVDWRSSALRAATQDRRSHSSKEDNNLDHRLKRKHLRNKFSLSSPSLSLSLFIIFSEVVYKYYSHVHFPLMKACRSWHLEQSLPVTPGLQQREVRDPCPLLLLSHYDMKGWVTCSCTVRSMDGMLR